MTEFRECGDIEQEAHVVGLLHRPHYYVKHSPEKQQALAAEYLERFQNQAKWQGRDPAGVVFTVDDLARYAKVIIDKQREGPVGPVDLRFIADYTKFEDWENLFLYVQDRDLWRWDLRFSREISAALATYPYDFATWEQIMLKLDDDIAFVELLLEGRVALRAMDRLVEIQAKQAVAGRIGGYDVPVCNCTAHVDEVCHKLLELNPASPFVAAYRDQAGKTRRWSLRSRVGFDCSEISKQYGGGGHAQASGFEEALSTIMTKCPHEGLMAIATERDHQYVKHGYKEDHDDVHRDGSLAKAAKCYLDTAVVQIAAEQETIPPCYSHKDWPWEPVEFHPETSVENLTKAGALIAAELDRLHRAAFPVNA
jgi:hypothetical protein